MTAIIKEKLISLIDKAVFFFFALIAFFLPRSGAVIESTAILLLMCFILKLALSKTVFQEVKYLFHSKINTAILVFYISIGFSLFVSGPLLLKSLRAWISKWGEGVLLFYLVQFFLRRNQVKTLIYIMLVSAFLVCLQGLYQKMFSVDLIYSGDFYRVKASFNHFNDFATFAAVMFLVDFSVLIYMKKTRHKLMLSLLAVMIAVNLFFTYSRGAWLSFLAGLSFFMMISPSVKMKKSFIFLLVILIVGSVSLPFSRELIISLIKRGDAARFEIWTKAILMFVQSPLIGVGLGLFMDKLPLYGLGPLYAHNCYLQILAETGLAGLLPFLWFIKEIISDSFRKLKKNKFDVLLLGLTAALISFMIDAFFDTQLYSLKLSMLFWLLASFVIVVSRDSTENQSA